MLFDSLCFMLADNHSLLRNGIAYLLQSKFPDCIINETSNSIDLLNALEKNYYDVIFVDTALPGLKGSVAAKRIREKNHLTKIIALSSYEDATTIVDMFDNGADAFLTKLADKEEILDAVLKVLDGMYYLQGAKSNHVLLKYLHNLRHSYQYISAREKEILLLICEGYSTKQVANKLNLAYKTIDNHRTHLLEKVGVNNTAGLVLFASKKGWV